MELCKKYNYYFDGKYFLRVAHKYSAKLGSPNSYKNNKIVIKTIGDSCPNVSYTTLGDSDHYSILTCNIPCDFDSDDMCCFECIFIDDLKCDLIKNYCRGF